VAAVIAGLRLLQLWQANRSVAAAVLAATQNETWIDEVWSNGGSLSAPLSEAEVDTLADRFNLGRVALPADPVRALCDAVSALADAFDAGDIREPYTDEGEAAVDALYRAADECGRILDAPATSASQGSDEARSPAHRAEIHRIAAELLAMGVGDDVEIAGSEAVDYLNELQDRLRPLARIDPPEVAAAGGRPAPRARRLANVRGALQLLRQARNLLAAVGARQSAEKVRRALKSTEGAERHARGLQMREEIARA
jgi:hypothetical protein